MGIEVTMVNQLPSYGVSQYNPTTGKTAYRGHINYKTYFNEALKTDCYDSYAEGKKVSDYLNFVVTDWTVQDQGGNMQHVKSAGVSHYIDTAGTEHGASVFFCSANLDENNYKGCNGNGGSQSGVIISDHDKLFQVVYNYMQLMVKYSGQEGLQEFWLTAHRMNEEQMELIKTGQEDKIPAHEQIVYLGTENDPVFELYFTPLGGGIDAWDTEYNPVSKYVDKLPHSTDYVEYFWNVYAYENKNYMSYALSKILESAYCDNPNPNNKIGIRVDAFDAGAIKQLKLGTEIGYRSLKGASGIHSKDMIMSYEEAGQRHYVSLMTSCNFCVVGFNYRTNSVLVIHETDETGNGFYKAFGPKYSYGGISKE